MIKSPKRNLRYHKN